MFVFVYVYQIDVCIQVIMYMLLVWMCIYMDLCIFLCIAYKCMYTSDSTYVSMDVYLCGSFVFVYVHHIDIRIQVMLHTVLYHDDLCRVQKRWALGVGGTWIVCCFQMLINAEM
jgi:hypothetical protein